MSYIDKKIDFLKTVCEQVRWKSARNIISQELDDHITDQTDAFIQQGVDEETALDNAVLEMGDPIDIGVQLDRTYRPKPNKTLIALTLIILIIGFITRIYVQVLSSKPVNFTQDFMTIIIAAGCMLAIYFIDYTMIIKYSRLLFVGLCILTIIIVVCRETVNGRHIFAVFLMLLFPFLFAGIVYSMRGKRYVGILTCGIFYVISAVFCMLLPSISSLLVVSISCLITLTVAVFCNWFNSSRLKSLFLIYIPTISALIFAIAKLVQNFQQSYLGDQWFNDMLRKILMNSQFIGDGAHVSMGASPEIPLKTAFSPFISDQMLTYLVHELGWISFIAILLLFTAFTAITIFICLKQKSILGRLVSISITSTLACQVVLYIMSNIGLGIISPLTLPLFSEGNSALIVNMILVGLLLSVFKSDSIVKDLSPQRTKGKPFFELQKGKLIINFTSQTTDCK